MIHPKQVLSAVMFLSLFAGSLSAYFTPTALAGGSSAGVAEVNPGDKHLTAGLADQLLLDFVVESWKSVPGDLAVQSIDITCAPAHGLTTVKLIKDQTTLLSTSFTAGKVAGTQTAHFGSSSAKLANGVNTQLRLIVTVEKNTGDFVAACAIDDLFLKNLSSGKVFSSEAQAVNFSVNNLVYVDDPLVSVSVPSENIADDELRLSKLGLGTKDNLLMDFRINAESDIRVEDLFVFCTNGDIFENYRLDIDGASVGPTAMQNDNYTNSRAEFSSDDRIVFANLGVQTGRGEGVHFKLYGDTYSYFSLPSYYSTICRVLDLRTANPLTGLEEVTGDEASMVTKTDTALITRLLGRILLQVENHGQAWYLDPASAKKYYLPDGATAYQALRSFGLGITNADLAKIQESTSSSKSGINASLTSKLKGRILLQVESHGEAWYVNPADGKRYYLKDGNAAYEIMRSLSLGITNADLRKIQVGMLPPVTSTPAPAPAMVIVECESDMPCFADAVTQKKNAHYAGEAVIPMLEAWIPGISVSESQAWDFSTTFDGPPYTFVNTTGDTTAIFANDWFEQFLQSDSGASVQEIIDRGTYLTPEELDELEPEVRAHYEELVAQGKTPQEVISVIAKESIESFVTSTLAITNNSVRTCTFSDLSAFSDVLKDWEDGNYSTEDMNFAECDTSLGE